MFPYMFLYDRFAVPSLFEESACVFSNLSRQKMIEISK